MTIRNLRIRKQEHEKDARAGDPYALHQTLVHFNFDVTWEEIDTGSSIEDLREKEKFYIEKYQTFIRKGGVLEECRKHMDRKGLNITTEEMFESFKSVNLQI